MFAVPSIGCSYERTSGGQASLGALPRSYQVTPAILGRRRATKAVEVRPRSTGTAGVSPSPPENQPARSDARRRPWIYGDSDGTASGLDRAGLFALANRISSRPDRLEEQGPVFGRQPPADAQAAVLLPFAGEEAVAMGGLGALERN